MSYNYTIKYRTFDQLLDSVRIDFIQYDLTNYIEPQQLIKIAKKVNYDLGLRIMMTKEVLLEIHKGRVKLPDDFYVLNFALICDEQNVINTVPQGTNMQELAIPQYQSTPANIEPCDPITVNCQKCLPNPCSCAAPACETGGCNTPYNPLVPFGNDCNKPRVFMNCKNDCYELVQIVKTQTTTYRRLLPLKILENPQDIQCGCPNLYLNTPNQAWIQNGYLYTSFQDGKVYVNYQGNMEDDDGNLLVPDHDMLNEYYEYAVKQRILENLIMNDEPVGQKLQLVEARLMAARKAAITMVRTPNFSEMKRVWQMNRKAQYHKYFNMFKSFEWHIWDRNPNNMYGEGITR